LDVTDPEPLPMDSPLLELENLHYQPPTSPAPANPPAIKCRSWRRKTYWRVSPAAGCRPVSTLKFMSNIF
ncbi:MAG: hypothetical protein HC875_21270, partial [Anaerolineales bacterium]|nr:hypothetical protein [Anaerolineales bacterium]